METTHTFEAYYIRHAVSYFNLYVDYQKLKSSPPDIDEAELKVLKNVSDKFSPLLVDPKLTLKGIYQCSVAKEEYSKLPLRCVFVSPLRRALETAALLLEGHPLRQQMKIIVHPLLTEMLAGSNEIPVPVKEKIEIYSRQGFDFELFKEYEDPDLYFLYNLNSPEREDILKKVKEEQGKKPYIEIVGEAARLRQKTFPSRKRKLENYENLRKRAKKFAGYALEHAKAHNLKSGEIAVVAHDTFIGHSVATEFNYYDKGIFKSLENCGYRLIDLNALAVAKY